MKSVETDPVRVLWLIKGLGRGGAETILEAALERFDPRMVRIDVAYVLPNKDALRPSIESMGVIVHCLAGSGRSGWLRNLGKLLRGHNYDIVHTHSPLVAIAARLLSPRGQMMMHTEHDVWMQYVLPTRVGNALTMRKNHQVFVISKAVHKSIRTSPLRWFAPDKRTELLYHGVDLKKSRRGAAARTEARRALSLDNGEVALIMVASMTERKNHAALLRSLRFLADEGHSLRLFLAGSGPLDDQVRSRVREWGLEHMVSFMGVRSDVREILPAFDALVLPSKNEGLGMVLIEALSAGVPVVASRVGGIPEVIGSFRGAILVQPEDSRELANAIRRVATEDRVATIARTEGPMYATRFDIQRAVDRMTRAYLAASQS